MFVKGIVPQADLFYSSGTIYVIGEQKKLRNERE
jgi:hypothetical protein